MLEILKFVPILLCSIFLGHWFFSEAKKAKKAGLKWFAPYFTIPGILIIIFLLLPLILYFN